MSERAVDVVVAGHLCLDMIPRFPGGAVRTLDEIVRPGVLVNVDRLVLATGGTVSNTGIAFRVFGCEVRSMAKVGDDAIGSLILEELERRGNAEGVRVAAGETSSYTVVIAVPGVDRVFLHCTGTNDTFTSDDVDPSIVAKARLFHFGYPPLMRRMFEGNGEELERVLRKARETGVTVSLDMAMPDPAAPSGRADWRTILRGALPHVDVFVPSIEEAFYCMHPQEYLRRKEQHHDTDLVDHMELADYRELGDTFLSMGCAMVALKAGGQGWYFRTGDVRRLENMGKLSPRGAGWAGRELWCPAYRVSEIASAAGSGDSSIAGFLTALLRGKGLEECLHLANCAGAHNLSGLDTVSGLKGWDVVESDSRKLPLGDVPLVAKAGWRLDPVRGVWEPGR